LTYSETTSVIEGVGSTRTQRYQFAGVTEVDDPSNIHSLGNLEKKQVLYQNIFLKIQNFLNSEKNKFLRKIPLASKNSILSEKVKILNKII
jgi:hypothetical protein